MAFGDNDSVRFSLIKGSCLSACGLKLMHFHLKKEADNGMNTWYARVPTEANISDFPSRGLPHPLLKVSADSSMTAKNNFLEMIGGVLADQAISRGCADSLAPNTERKIRFEALQLCGH